MASESVMHCALNRLQYNVVFFLNNNIHVCLFANSKVKWNEMVKSVFNMLIFFM